MHDRMTAGDVKKIQDEIEHRKLVVRKEALEDVKEARAHGDLSENFEYKAAKQYKNKNESRIRYLERLLRTAILITEEAAEGEVDINNSVTIFFLEDGIEETYKLVTTVRSNSVKARISIESPLGKAIYRRKVGEQVRVKISDTISYLVEIRKIDPTTEEEMDEISKY